MRTYIKLLLWLSLLFTQLAFANDSAGTTAAGGIQFIKTPTVKMLSEDLTMSASSVKVDYVFKNISNKDVTTQVFFPLPPYQMQGANLSWDNEVFPNKNAPFTNFSVVINGQPIKYQIKTQALLNGKDIAPMLIKAGIPLNTQLAAAEVPMDDQQSANFKQWHAKAQQLGLLDHKGYPRWQKQVSYYWTQTFPAGQTLTVTHQYRPAAGEFYVSIIPNAKDQMSSINDGIQRIKALFKINLADLAHGKNFHDWLSQQTLKPTAGNGIFAFIYNVDYVLTTGANWAGPIQQFALTLKYPTDGAVAYNHFYTGQPSKIINMPGETKIFLNNFTPKQNLHVLFGKT